MYKEEVELDEATNYEIKNGKIHISKANFRKVHKDYKNSTKGKERMMALDPKSGATTSYEVVFEEVELDESKKALKAKSEKSGVSVGILSKVYDRGMAAYKTGHRPGTTPQQWALARVNSFLTGGGARKADNDLWQQAKKQKKEDLDREDELKEQPEHEITVGGYTTKFFYMCGTAQKVMKKNADVEGAEELTKLQDDFYKLEKDVMDAGSATDGQKILAKEIYNKIMELAGKVELADDIDNYMKMHLDSIEKGDPKPGFGRTDIKEDLDEGKMSQLHQLMKDGKSAKEIVKIMKLDVKTIKALVDEQLKEDITVTAATDGGISQRDLDHVQKELRRLGIKDAVVDQNEMDKNKIDVQTKMSDDKVKKAFDKSKMTVTYESARRDAMRAMRKDKEVDPADIDDIATDDDVKAASKNIIMQLRKSVSLRGNFPVEFMDKKKVKVDAKIAAAVQDKYNSIRKASDKQKFTIKVAKSYKDMLSALKEEVVKEGTWALPDTPKLKAGLKKLMMKKIPLGKDGDDAIDKIGEYIGDDELYDDLYTASKKNGPKGDARPIIRGWMDRNFVDSWEKYRIETITILNRIDQKIQERKNG